MLPFFQGDLSNAEETKNQEGKAVENNFDMIGVKIVDEEFDVEDNYLTEVLQD